MRSFHFFLVISFLLTACASQVTVEPTQGIVADAVEPSPEATQPSAEQLMRADVIAQIQADPKYQSAYVQALQQVLGQDLSETCADFAVRLNEESSPNTFGITSDGVCYAIIRNSDGSETIVFNNKDTNGYLYVRYNPSEHPEGSIFEYKDTESGFWATISVDGKVVRAVDGRTSQWVDVIDGQMMDANGQPTPIPTMTPINADPNETRPAVKMIDPEAMTKLIADYKDGNLTDLSSLTIEQRNAFSETLAKTENDEAGINFVSFTYVKDEEYYLDPKTLEDKEVPSNPTEEFLKENSFVIYSQVEYDAAGNLMYKFNGEWRTVQNSAGVDLGTVISDPNDPNIELPRENRAKTYLTEILANTSPAFATEGKLVVVHKALGEVPFESGPAYYGGDMFMVTEFITNASGKAILAKTQLVTPRGIMHLSKEGGLKEIIARSGLKINGEFWQALEEDQLYYLFFAKHPKEAMQSGTGTDYTGNLFGVNESEEIDLIVGVYLLKLAETE